MIARVIGVVAAIRAFRNFLPLGDMRLLVTLLAPEITRFVCGFACMRSHRIHLALCQEHPGRSYSDLKLKLPDKGNVPLVPCGQLR
jgi:hypothetical protein